MKRIKLAFLICIVTFQCTFNLIAQPYPLSLNIQVSGPYTANYTDYYSGTSQVVLTIVNNSTNTYDIYLAGEISANNGAIRVSTSGESAWSAPALVVPPGSHSYNGSSLQPFAQNPNADYTGITLQDISSGLLPEGDYQICLRAYGYNSLQPLSPGEPMGCSNVFTISYPPPPQIIAPLCGNTLIRSAPQNIIFSWQTPTGIPPSVSPRYKFTLVQLTDGIDPISALDNPVDPVYETEVNTTTLSYGSIQPILQSPRMYAWRVQILDANVFPPQDPSASFQNNGYSEPCTFNYLEPGSSGNPFTLVYPIDGDTLPWDYMPIYHRFDPYSVNYTAYSHKFKIFKNGTLSDVYNPNNSWGSGPELSQEHALGDINITQEQAQHINLYKPMAGVSPAAIAFMNGNSYTWDADIEIENSAGPEVIGSLNGSFTSGMGRPRPIYPANLDSVVKEEVLELKFTTSAPPQRLVPPLAIMQTSSTPGPHFFNGGLSERWILEVSRNQSFSTLVTSTTQKLGAGLNYQNGTCQEQCLLDSLYKDVTFNYTPTDTGWYFWRVRWLSNPNELTGASYLDGPTWKFLVKDSIRIPEDTIPATPAECVNTCLGPIIPASEKVPVSTAVVGNVVSIGMFSMTLTEITWSGSSATGKGTIRVPFMRAPMKVQFSGIKINANNRVYQGDVRGEYDNVSIIPGGITQGVSQITSLNQEQSVALNTFVNSTGRLVSQFATDNPIGLPIGLDQEVDDQRVTIGIVGLLFTPETATLNAMVSMGFAELNGWLSLGATNVCFHPDGIGGDGKGLLYLPADHDIPFGDSITLRFDKTEFNSDFTAVSDSGTYVSWDCRGFKALNVDGSVIFGRNILVEDKTDGTTGPAQIKGEFSCRIRRQGQWLARLNFNHPFQMAGAAGWGFDVEEAWLDFSDGQNPDGFHFPTGYEFDTTAFTGDLNLESIPNPGTYWRGFYLKRLAVRMPPQFETYTSPGARLTASVNNMLIDRRGLSASFRVENIINVGDGNLAGWGFSIDTLNIDIVKNSFSRGGFVGDIRIPASDSALHYSSMLRQNLHTRNFSYEFRITPKDTINAALWAAKLSLLPTSYISAVIDSSGIFARAELSGNITINTELPAVGRVNFRFMDFEELAFQTRAPYIDCDSNCVRFAFASPQKFLGGDATDDGGGSSGGLSGFPVSINDIGLTMENGPSGPKAGLEFTLSLNLTGETNTFSAATSLAILGKLNLDGGQGQVWEFDGVELDSIGVSGSVGVVSISGGLRFYNNDATYGNGFKGIIQASFKPTISAKVAAQFGEKQGNRYWFVDAQVVFNPGITLMAGLDVYGFGGGAYYHMQRTTPLPSAAGMATADTSGKQAPGLTLSGVNYVPNFSNAFGFSATVIFGNTGGGQAYNADVTFGAEFSNSGGISLMYLRGNAYFMCDITERTDPQIHALADISYDFVHQIFDARFQATVNIAAGLVKGVNPGNIAGTVQIYASPETWFIHVGNPTTPIGLTFLNLFSTRSYLMVGKNLPPALPPPDNVTSIITPSTLASFRRTNDTDKGDGFAFGSSMDWNESFDFLMFYARMRMGVGFDMALKNYGPNVFCEGAPPGSTIGVDGWYADGKIYAYINGEIGIHVDLWMVSGDFKILGLGAAALLQGGLPNPSWVQGTIGGYYNILGGMVKGNCQYEFKLGDECRPALENPIASTDILSQLVPYNGEQNVDCGINPEASFNLEVEREFDLVESLSNGSNVSRRFRFVIERFDLKKGGALIQTTRQISPDHFKAMLIPSAFLDPFTEFVVSIKIKAEEYNFTTSTWSQALKRDGTPINAELAHTFKTGAYPDRIPEENVIVTYPFNTQRFYLQNECNQGFVKLKQWQAPNFNPQPAPTTRRSFNVRFIPIDGGPELNTELSFNASAMTLNFEVPTLLNNKVYACQIISKDTLIGTALNALSNAVSGGSLSTSLVGGSAPSSLLSNTNMMITSTLQEVFSSQGTGLQTRNNRINGRTVRKNEKLLYVFFFKTSQYNTLQEKLNAFAATTTERTNLGVIEWLAPSFSGPEKFDVFDVNGYRTSYPKPPLSIKPLVGMTEARTGNWHPNWANPIIYDLARNLNNYGYTGLRLIRPSPDTIGIPPIYTVRFHSGNPTRNALQPSEFMPLSSSPNSIFGSSISMFSGSTSSAFSSSFSSMGSMFSGGAPAAMKLNVETASRTWLDWRRLTTISNNVQVNFGSPYSSEFYSEPVRTQFINFLNDSYRMMYRGSYQTRFFFRSPFYMCTDPDFFNAGTLKNYTY